MRIEAGAAFQAYQAAKAQAKERIAVPETAKQASGKTDTLSISERGLQEHTLKKQVQHMAAEVEAQGAEARLTRLATEIRRGIYQVPAQALAEAMLGTDI